MFNDQISLLEYSGTHTETPPPVSASASPIETVLTARTARPDLLAARTITAATEFAPLEPLIYYCDGVSQKNDLTPRLAEFFYRGTYSQIKGQSGSRKSTLIRAIIQAAICGDSGNKTLTATKKGLNVLLIDTEQHPSRVSRFVRYICAAEPVAASHLRAVSCRGLSSDEIQDLIFTAAFDAWRPDIIVLDVITHLVSDINDQKAADNVVRFLNAIMQTGAAVVGVIHQNPDYKETTGKATGALGTKLLQLAEMEFCVERLPVGSFVDKAMPSSFCSLVSIVKFREKYPTLSTLLVYNDRDEMRPAVHVCPVEVFGKGTNNTPQNSITDDKGKTKHVFAHLDLFRETTGAEWSDKFTWFKKTADGYLSDFYNGKISYNTTATPEAATSEPEPTQAEIFTPSEGCPF